MLRTTRPLALRLISPATLVAVALAAGGCITPATVTSVDVDNAAAQPSATLARATSSLASASIAAAATNPAAAATPSVATNPADAAILNSLLSVSEQAAQRPVAARPTDVPTAASDTGPIATFARARIEAVAPPMAIAPQPAAELLPAAPPQVRAEASAPPPTQPADGQLSDNQRIKSIRQISLDITPPAIYDDTKALVQPPYDYAAEALPALAAQQPYTRGDLIDGGYEWHPEPVGLTFCYQPLYFEEVNLERYGRSYGILQPVVSLGNFYGRIPLLPYMALAQPARRCTYQAHWTLPGYRIPGKEPHEFVPSLHGAAAEVAALYGIILLIP
jgi:hypothetical protein